MKNTKSLHTSVFLMAIAVSLVTLSSCKKDDLKPAVNETGTMTDVDGNVYKTVNINGKWWMAENLKVTHYRNGNTISQVQDPTAWENARAAYCQYDNNATAPGLLYNFAAVTHPDQIAPEGWRIPTDTDWKELEKYLGMDDQEVNNTGWRGEGISNKLRMYGESGWRVSGENWPTDESGFSAEAGACRIYDGRWGYPGLFFTGFWWTGTEKSSEDAWFRHLDYKESKVYRAYESKISGFSIRCIKE